MMYKIRFFCFLLVVLAVFAGCSTPSPLSGKWADGNGSLLVLNPDMSFQITLKGTQAENYDGSYSVSNNALVFSFSDRAQSVVSEWDMRGSIMSIEWPNLDDTTAGQPFKILKLYKVG